MNRKKKKNRLSHHITHTHTHTHTLWPRLYQSNQVTVCSVRLRLLWSDAVVHGN